MRTPPHVRRLLVWIVALVWFAPYLWLVMSAFKSRNDITTSPPRVLFSPTLTNVQSVYNGQSLLEILLNSATVSVCAATFAVILAIPAAHLFARSKTRATRRLFVFVLGARVAPPVALSLPLFLIFSSTGMRGSIVGLIIAHTAFNLPVAIWLLEGFFGDIPEDIEMAARIDGQSEARILRDITLPLAKGGIAVTFFFAFLFSWNEYMMSSLLSSSSNRLITPALPAFVAQATTQWGQFCYVALVATIPAMLMVLFGRRHLANAFSMGAVREEQDGDT